MAIRDLVAVWIQIPKFSDRKYFVPQIQNTLGLTVKSQQTFIHQMTSAIFPREIFKKGKTEIV